jgi:hypothetical protein
LPKLSRAEVIKHAADANYITSPAIQEQIRSLMTDYGNGNEVAILGRSACSNIVKHPDHIRIFESPLSFIIQR